MSCFSSDHPSHRVVHKDHPSHQPFVIKEGGTILVTKEMLLQLQLPKCQPKRGGLPFVVILKRCKRGRVVLPSARITQGFALFLGDGLRHNQHIPVVWCDRDSSASAVCPEDVEAYKALFMTPELESPSTFIPPELEKS